MGQPPHSAFTSPIDRKLGKYECRLQINACVTFYVVTQYRAVRVVSEALPV